MDLTRCLRCMGMMIAVGLLAGRVAADDVETLQRENQQLRERLDRLEREVEALRKELRGGWPRATEFTEREKTRLKELAARSGQPVRAGLDIELYGYVKLDAAYDDSRVNAGNFARWVESEATRRDEDQFHLTANQTRLGLRVKGPESKTLLTSGLVEVDFYGGGTENKPNPMMRHAYLTATWPEWQLSILVGQASDVISPLVAPTINYSVAWWQGNIGYRRPQVRLTKTLLVAEQVEAKLELALARTIGRTNSFTGPNYDTGQQAGPSFQGRASVSVPGFVAGKPAVAGVSGHFAREEYANDQYVDSWSLNGDLTLPITKWLSVQAEYFYGENLDAYLGGVGQGVRALSPTNYQAITARGGWVAVTLTPWSAWQFNVGAGYDDPVNRDIPAGGRTCNQLVFGNVWYSFNANLSLGLEISYLRTHYRAQADGDAWREQLSLIYKF